SISARESSATFDVPGKSPVTVCSSDSATDTGEGLLERTTRREAGGVRESPAIERAREFDEIERPRRHVVQPEIEELLKDHPGEGLRERERDAPRLPDRHRQRHRARPDQVEHAVRPALEG